MADEALNELPAEENQRPVSAAQFNLFTGAAEPIPVEVSEPEEPRREIRVDEGIALVKTEDGSQLILSGYGFFLRHKRGENKYWHSTTRAAWSSARQWFWERSRIRSGCCAISANT